MVSFLAVDNAITRYSKSLVFLPRALFQTVADHLLGPDDRGTLLDCLWLYVISLYKLNLIGCLDVEMGRKRFIYVYK